MDEMTQLRELRAGAPAPDRSALAPGRQRLTDAIAGKRQGRRLRADWRIASLGAAVAVTVAALLGTQLLDASDPRSTGPATVAGDLDLSGPAQTLGRAADFLEDLTPPPEPRDDQWIYTRQVIGQPEPATGDAQRGKVQYDPDSWTPYGNAAAEKDGSDDDRSARQIYRAANALPADPAALLAEVRDLYPSGADTPESEGAQTFRGLGVLMESYPLAPAALARIYRAMATVPGVEITDHLVEDAAGREAIAVTREEEGTHQRRELLLSPYDYSYAGLRFVVAEDHEMKLPEGTEGIDPKLTAGDITLTEARTAAAVVDAEGDKP
ncbi:CU044_5270 family protein [Streptomyces sp. NBC_01166]|uniref:CU044_5270 family protein n=1 Tax=Streptomyces sp. NBC_01166 TaxID=2903755 RepID=UPI00386A772E|nr:CU044_5270 family protein [Streptomyces sp. NBC_01166]